MSEPTSNTASAGAAKTRLRVAIASDHEGDRLKERLALALREDRHSVKDCEVYGVDAADFTDLAELVGRTVVAGDADLGVMIASSGPGASTAASKLTGVRAVNCQDPVSAVQSRRQLDANVLCLDARVLGDDLAVAVAQAWLDAEFTGEDRHRRLRDKIDRLDAGPDASPDGGPSADG